MQALRVQRKLFNSARARLFKSKKAHRAPLVDDRVFSIVIENLLTPYHRKDYQK